jgi:DNA-binding LacI/PurR family transcriptional regulator
MFTLKDVALKAKVSPMAVSLALRGKKGVGDQTRKRIMEIADRLNYRPNLAARSLVQVKTGLVGILTAGYDQPGQPYDSMRELYHLSHNILSQKIIKGLSEHGLQVIIAMSHNSPADDRKCMESLADRRVDGLVLLSGDLQVSADVYNQLKMPCVIVDNEKDGLHADTIRVDRSFGLYAATSHLLKLGHRRILLILDQCQNRNMSERLDGYKRAMADHDCPLFPGMIVRGDQSLDSFYEITRTCLDEKKPTAIIALNDISCPAIYKAIKEKGLSVPGDISLIGHDDFPLASYFDPPLTTIRQPYDHMAKTIVDRLVQRINDETGQQGELDISLKGELIIRQSVGPCNC